ncbi:MAG TPA: hypothetical protein VHY55_10625, partial [Acidimicrobiia bacterium]|nr:hypothetical protein [Acidimicrobiia bacterium]
SGTPIVSPVTTGDVTWDELCHDDPELASWCADRWLGAWRPLPPLPARDAFAPTRAARHTLAEHVLARARYDANGKIGLRYTRRGVGTPGFRRLDQDAQLRLDRTNVVAHRDGETRSIPVTTVAAAAEVAGVEPGAPDEVYTPATALAPDTSLVLDGRSVEFLGAWFGFAASVLEQVRAEADSLDQPSRVQLWPEHFDLSVDLGDERAGRRGTFGASPGDDVDPDPYLYVTHSGDVAENEYWNEEHFPGASLTMDTLAAAPDQRASALTFLRRGRELLRGP